MNLPEGFEVDSDQKNNLPPGFIIDENKSGFSENLEKGANLFKKYKNSPLFKASPLGLLESSSEMVSNGLNKGGELITEALGKRQVNPNISAGVGLAVQMAPDIAMTAMGMGGSEAARAAKNVPEVAIPFARRAIGKSMSMLKTPNARREANLAARTALEEGVIPRLGSPDVMFDRAANMARESGKKIGDTLSKIDFWKLAPEAELDLESTRNALTRGTREGVFSGANSLIDKVKTTISQLYGRELDANVYNAAKNELADSVNYLADKASQKVNKKVANSMAQTIRRVVNKLLPESYEDFLNNQRLFNRATSMTEGLNPELAKQMGNKMVSPYSFLAGVGQLAAGQPGQAVASAGLGEVLLKRGAGTSARMLTSASRALPTASAGAASIKRNLFSEKPVPPLISPAKDLNRRTFNILPRQKANEYYLRAGKDKQKARQMALDDGWRLR